MSNKKKRAVDGRAMGSGKKPVGNRLNDGGDARRAVVDIGSNSVRLVVYDGPVRAPIPICNEKALCGLGRDMTSEGGLNPSAVEDALQTLARFRHVLDDLGRPPVQVIATSAVRVARDGGKFVEAAGALGFDVDVLSGDDEGLMAANGVLSVVPDADGLVGDMGGGSLELSTIADGGVKHSASLPIGPLSIMRETGPDIKAAAKLIEKHLDELSFVKAGAFSRIYAVGGAWRAVARIHMGLRSYPLSVLHHYELSAAQAMDVCDLVARQSRRSLEEIPGIPRRRLDTLPFAALALKAVLARTKIKKVVVSSGGVREGLLYRELSKQQRAEDPYLAACRFYANRLSPDPDFGEAVFSVVEPLFAQVDGARLRRGVSLLCDIGAYFHPDQRARHAFDTALRAPFVGVTHQDRLWGALALFRRHKGRSSPTPEEQAMSLLSWDEQLLATQYGLALRFAAALAPKASSALKGCSLERRGGSVVFCAPSDRKALMGENPRRRLASLASAFEAEPAEVYED